MTTTATDLGSRIDARWDDDVLPTLTEYIRIPNVSKAFDSSWEERGSSPYRPVWSVAGREHRGNKKAPEVRSEAFFPSDERL